jgi:hypothetical protein
VTVAITVGVESVSLITEHGALSVAFSWIGLAILFAGTLIASVVASHAAGSEGDAAGKHGRGSVN